MTTYSNGEKAWITILKVLPDWHDDNVSRGNYRILNKGKSDFYCIVIPGQANFEEGEAQGFGFSNEVGIYQTKLQFWQKYNEDGESLAELTDLVSVVADHFKTYRRLGGSVASIREARIITQAEPLLIPATKPRWIVIEMVGEWINEEKVSYVD